MEEFCVNCEILIRPGLLGVGKTPAFRFKEGVYCEKCAKKKVERARR